MKLKNLYYGFKGLQAYNKQAKEANVNLKPTKENQVHVIMVDDKEISIHYIPDINKRGIVYGGIIVNPITHKTYMCVDDYFYAMPERIRNAVIYHEVGHYVHGHFNNKGLGYIWNQCVELGKIVTAKEEDQNALILTTLLTRDYTEEFEADAYAIECCGKNDVLALLLTLSETVPGPEVNARYKKIAGEDLTLMNAFKTALSNAQTISMDSLEQEEM